MNITELRYLVAIRKWGSVSAAAKQLYAAQPNVSKALKNLEEEYGIRIFERSSTGMIPTEQGRHFIRQAERVLDEVVFIREGVMVLHKDVDAIREAGRATQGVIVMRFKEEGDRVISMALTDREQETEKE